MSVAAMGSRQLIVFGIVLTCVRLRDARFLSLTVPTYWGVEDQEPAEVQADPAAGTEREHSRDFAQQAGRLQARQVQLAPEPLSWTYPEDPVDPVNLSPVKFELLQPAVPHRFAVRCGHSRIQVEVSQNLLGNGKLIKPEDVSLGSCSVSEIDNVSHVLIFERELHDCGSILVMTETALIYAFALVYNPKVLGRSDIIRSQSVVIGVECHYPT